jgi:cytochrome c556
MLQTVTAASQQQDRALAEALAAVEQTSPSLSPVGSPQRKASAAAAPQQWETVSKRKTRKSKQGKDLEGAAADAATNAAAADSNGGTD